MNIPIFFRDELENNLILKLEEIEHLKSLRLFQVDKTVEFRNGRGISQFYQIDAKSKKGNFLKQEIYPKTQKPIEIITALPKSERLDLLLQKGTEIGVTKFIFVNFLQSERKEFNSERAKKITREASSQSKRHFLPLIESKKRLDEIISDENFFYLNPSAKNKISTFKNWGFTPIIGPEGGFREEEILFLESKGIEGYSIGENILRIETAFLYLASIKSFQNESIF